MVKSACAEVGQALVDLCREGKDDQAVERFYAADIVSVEAGEIPGMPAEQRGIESIRQKHQWWHSQFEVNGMTIEGPFVNGDRFTTFNRIDVTHKESGQRMNMSEVAEYEVKDGKIVREHFFALPQDVS